MKKILIILVSLMIIVGCATNKTVVDSDTLYYVVELDGGKIVLAPKEYKEELHDEFEKELIEMPLASPIEYYDTTVNTTVTDNIQKDDLIVLRGTVETITDAMDFGCPYVFVECNDDNEVNAVILYGELAFK